MRGWLYRVAWVVGCGLACVVGLAKAQENACGFPRCEEYIATVAAAACNMEGYGGCRCRDTGEPRELIVAERLRLHDGQWLEFAPFGYCNCDWQPLDPSFGFTEPPDGTCESGCKVEFDPDPVSVVEMAGKTWYYGKVGPTGEQCNASTGAPPPVVADEPPCERGTCVENQPPAPPQVCKGDKCIAVPDMPDCEADATSALCAGKGEPPNAPEPPPPPDPPIGPDIEPLSPPPPLITMCSGPDCINITINEYDSNNPGGDGGDGGAGDDGDGDGDDDGQGINLCPDGSRPVDGQCGASNTPCPDGTSPSQGTCVADPRVCADGLAPVDGVCGGNGECEGGGLPQNGHCGWTCPDGSHPLGGRCDAGWAPCQDGSQPVNGQCQAGTCNPESDPNQCGHGHAEGGETCGSPPGCFGDQIACATLYQTWATRCSLSPPEGDPGEGLEDLPGPESAWDAGGVEPDPGWMDMGGYGLPRGCPQVPSVEVLGTTVNFPPVWCELLATMGTLLIIGVSYSAAKIAGGA